MKIIKSSNFVVESHEHPEVSRNDGGHLVINPKNPKKDRTVLSKEEIIELALLTNLVGQAFVLGMAKSGVNIGRVNYQDNGNRKPELHIHLYGRSPDATYQIYGQPIITPRTKEEKIAQKGLDSNDCTNIRREYFNIIKNDDRYSDLKLEKEIEYEI